jgi:hypothetical protein
MQWIFCKELLKHPYNLTKRQIWAFVEDGRLIPHDGRSRRVFPTIEQEQKGGHVRDLQETRDFLNDWLASSDEVTDFLDVLQQNEIGRSMGAETFIVHEDFMVKRARRESELADVNIQIGNLESDLDPSKAWKNLNVSPGRQNELWDDVISQSAFAASEVEKLSVAESATEAQCPFPVKEEIGFRPPANKKKRQDQKDREAVENWAQDYFKQFKEKPDAAPELIDVVKIAQEQLDAAKGWDERTLVDWIRPFHLRYTPGKPGRKKGCKKVKR